jgi:hypothetical protein
MGELMPLGKPFGILAICMFGPNLPTEKHRHADRLQVWKNAQAAKYALNMNSIKVILEWRDQKAWVIYMQGLLTTACASPNRPPGGPSARPETGPGRRPPDIERRAGPSPGDESRPGEPIREQGCPASGNNPPGSRAPAAPPAAHRPGVGPAPPVLIRGQAAGAPAR